MEKKLVLVVDQYGCPNRCKHCWLGHSPNTVMPEDTDTRLIEAFRPCFDAVTYYSWSREPDFCDGYAARWERDCALSIGEKPRRFELASFWRLARDPAYADFLRRVGTKTVQLTFFGTEAQTDCMVGRKGAFRELLQATETLLDHRIAPRWQVFIDEENREQILPLRDMADTLRLPERCAAFGGGFRFFVHEGSCDGENRKRYLQRIRKSHIPAEILPNYLDYGELETEAELCLRLREDTACPAPKFGESAPRVVYVSNNFDLYFNFTHMLGRWKIGNFVQDTPKELARRIWNQEAEALTLARSITVSELVLRYGNPLSERAFRKNDFIMYLLNQYVEEA